MRVLTYVKNASQHWIVTFFTRKEQHMILLCILRAQHNPWNRADASLILVELNWQGPTEVKDTIRHLCFMKTHP